MLNQDINPYKVSPMEFGMIYTLHEDQGYSGDSLYHYINHSGFATLSAIYPPIVISMFRLIDNPISLGFLFIGTEALLLILLFLYIKKYSPNYFLNMKLICAWYVHPLVLYEGHLNRHYDLWIGLLIVGAIVFYNDHKTKLHSVLFALAIHLKGYSIIYLPFFKHSRWRILLVWLSFEVCSYLWYPSRFLKKSSLNTFINQWEFNNGLFTYLRVYLENIAPLEQALLYTRIVFLLIFIIVFLTIYYKWYFRTIKHNSFILMSVLFFICSPVANPWYFLMAVPFYINYCDRYNQHYFISLLSFYYLFYIGVDPLESLALITGIAWFILSLSFYNSKHKIKDHS
ncbi:MAG: hypothetical protein KC646_10610 [Candidatus Cloacimonetes bacterium]|nr:hypothetical protein [Candidatus Cloacimonadota bacterium]